MQADFSSECCARALDNGILAAPKARDPELLKKLYAVMKRVNGG
jgi:hypothetical protein